jgi:hypothetical protein
MLTFSSYPTAYPNGKTHTLAPSGTSFGCSKPLDVPKMNAPTDSFSAQTTMAPSSLHSTDLMAVREGAPASLTPSMMAAGVGILGGGLAALITHLGNTPTVVKAGASVLAGTYLAIQAEKDAKKTLAMASSSLTLPQTNWVA